MATIGAPLRKWTLFLLLLLCTVPTCPAQLAANDTAVSDSTVSPPESTTTTSSSSTVSATSHVSSASAAITTSSTSSSSLRKYTETETACPSRTFNYITHTLPQQCAKTSWSAPSEVDVESKTGSDTKEGVEKTIDGDAADATAVEARPSGETAVPANAAASSTASIDSDHELETDSPFDNANFLSFEEWKKKNLAEVGQSPENVGQGRAAASKQAGRRRPVNVNALDSLGDEGEIEIDFSGFGTPVEGEGMPGEVQTERHGTGDATPTDGEGKATPSSWALSKDAGKTCKERFNYASFDCAATVLKTNKKAKSSSSILVENKDSYMLNECSADNKFLIVELCDDILVDTIVLANYEFFSSMFRHFRVSVSDRYPVKTERWRTLGTFEARNSRDIQPFLITEPQIWARYLRVEFLTHYGNEFYCPLSLLRVHGTTMMEQFRREEEEARGVDDDEELDEAIQSDLVKPRENSGPLPPDQIPIQPVKVEDSSTEQAAVSENTSTEAASAVKTELAQTEQSQETGAPPTTSIATGASSSSTDEVSQSGNPSSVATVPPSSVSVSSNVATTKNGADDNNTIIESSSTDKTKSSRHTDTPSSQEPSPGSSSSIASRNETVSGAKSDTTAISVSTDTASKQNGNGTAASSQVQSPPRGSSTQPNPAAPSTQESFFKSIHKRLQSLEANSTLSLQYIEEQSRILRDAFIKVEKRQLAKAEKFLDHLNGTVIQDLKSYRNMYEQLWQSTIIELESMKERQRSEIGEIGARLSLVADELVWQKRMAVVQSTLLLLCLGLVLFVRSGTLGSAADVPIVQQLGSKYTSFFESSPPRSPENSGMLRRRRTLRSMWRSDTSNGLSDGAAALSDADTDGARSPHLQVSYHGLPTPTTPAALGAHDATLLNPDEYDGTKATATQQDSSSDPEQAKRLQILETQSGPATPNGTRDSRPSWEEVDRAMDQLKAEEQGIVVSKATEDRRKKKRSPLRRANSSYTTRSIGELDVDDDDDDDGNGVTDVDLELELGDD